METPSADICQIETIRQRLISLRPMLKKQVRRDMESNRGEKNPWFVRAATDLLTKHQFP
jgi:hypothetical protein